MSRKSIAEYVAEKRRVYAKSGDATGLTFRVTSKFLVEAAGLICLGKHRARHSPGGRERAGRFRSVQTASIRRLSIAGDSVRQCWGLQPQLGLPALERFPPFSARTGGCGIHCPRGDAEDGGNRSNVAIIRSSLTAVALFPHLRQSTKYTCSIDVTAQAQCQRRATLDFTAQRSER